MATSEPQVHFTGKSKCPEFVANAFKKDICKECQNKIQSHDKATQDQIVEALEYAVSKGKGTYK